MGTFTIADSVFGSAFFVATGFHGLHVIVGTLFLFTCYLRINTGLLSSTHHFGLLAPIILTFCRCSLIILVQMTIQLEVTIGKLCERSQYHSYAHTEDGVIFNAPATKSCGILKHY